MEDKLLRAAQEALCQSVSQDTQGGSLSRLIEAYSDRRLTIKGCEYELKEMGFVDE